VIPAAIVLARRLGALKGETRSGGARFERALNLARVLAHVTSDDTQRPMRAAGWKSLPKDSPSGVVGDAERPRLSEQRFRRLLSTESGEDQVQAFVRLIGLLDDKVNIASVSEDFWFWSDRTKRAWAFDYYAAGIAAPAEGPSTAEESA
jgi:CRISPR system Cascade subunit CasB